MAKAMQKTTAYRNNGPCSPWRFMDFRQEIKIAKRVRDLHRALKEVPIPRKRFGIFINEMAEKSSDGFNPTGSFMFS